MFLIFDFFLFKILIIYYFTRNYHANVDETRRKIKELIKENEWDSDEFPELKQNLLNKLNIQEKSDNDLLEILVKRVNDISNVQSSYKQIFEEYNKKMPTKD